MKSETGPRLAAGVEDTRRTVIRLLAPLITAVPLAFGDVAFGDVACVTAD